MEGHCKGNRRGLRLCLPASAAMGMAAHAANSRAQGGGNSRMARWLHLATPQGTGHCIVALRRAGHAYAARPWGTGGHDYTLH